MSHDGISAEGWVLIITAIGGAIASIIAAFRSGRAADSATAAKHQAALTRQVIDRTEQKIDHNNEMTAVIKKQTNGTKECQREDCPSRILSGGDRS